MSEKQSPIIVKIEEDPVTHDLIIPFPSDVIGQMGWSEGTDLWWEFADDGKIIITEVKNDDLDKDKNDRLAD